MGKMQEVRIHGYGGQGTVTMADLIAYAELLMGREIQTLPSFGMERRGSPVQTSMRLSDEEILIRSNVHTPGYLAVLNEKLVGVAMGEGHADRAHVVVNRSTSRSGSDWPDYGEEVSFYVIDAVEIARSNDLELMGQPLINIPMFGAMARILGIPKEFIEASIKHKWPKGDISHSVKGAERGYEEVM
ncbi:MAG: 2-oxoacid:acceptor oxidoreductase family protein [Clostridiales Family XIII bacterium]|jgi:pyruvate ferredoxin oxidoreductase gamma subunit|nr:2-oxoacid:acceptor oxidoreductase family protein [Clostridiales Family XIII bacterium]